jgi:hypothetical protein
MKAVLLCAGTLFLAASLAGCAAQYPSDITRFHLNQPIARGEIAIEPADPARTASIEYRGYAQTIGRQLARLGWTVIDGTGRSEHVATVHVEQGMRDAPGGRSPVTIGVGGSTGGWRSGVGVGASVGLGGGSRQTVTTLLEVKIRRRSDGTVFWEGRATTEARANSPEAQPAAAVEKLAEALFRDFPGESGRTIRVK